MRTLLQILLTAALALPLSLPAPAAHGSVVRALSMEQLVQRADHIVLAVAEEKQSRRHHDGRMIVTDVSLRVEQVLKGETKAGSVLIATCLGGKLETVALQVPGEATFALGERAVVFLRTQDDGQLRVVGMSQGMMPVAQQAQTTMVIPGGSHAALVEQDAETGKLEPAKPALVAPTPLTSVLSEIAALVARQQGAR